MAKVAKQPVVLIVDHFTYACKFTGGLIETDHWPVAEEFKDYGGHVIVLVGYGADSLGRKY
jgi:hypothetical protein